MNLEEVLRFVSPKVRDAALRSAAQLSLLGIRHALAGGLAVGAYGYVRATADVVFLVGEEAFEKHGLLVTFKAGVPIEVDGIRIDYLSAVALGSQMERVFDQALTSAGIAIVPIEALIYMKLVARRRKDQVDVIELLKSGIDHKPIRLYLQQNAADLTPLFDELVLESMDECA